MKKKKRKGRLRYDRIFMALFIIFAIVFSIKFAIYLSYNNKIYKTVTNSNNLSITINKKYNKLKLYNKTIKYIKENKNSVIISSKKYSVTIPSKNITKNANLDVSMYSKRLEYDNFSKSKAYFIDNKGIISKSNKIKILLPRYLLKNDIVDIYGVTKDNKIEEINLKVKIKDKKVSFDLNEKYSKYFITYVKLKDIKVKDITLNKGSKINLDIKYVPIRATVKSFEYIKIGDIFMLNDNNELIAEKSGTDKVTIKINDSNIKKDITINVKEEEKKKPIIKVIDGLTYVNDILIVNKTYELPSDYDPGQLSDEAISAFNTMKEAAKKDNISLWIASGYRSYTTQDELYNYYLKHDTKDKVDTYSARPGHSEHQTGLAMDLNIVDSSFEGTKEAIWIEENCYKYGFIIRYPKGKENITGYKYEPWHVRYLGKDLAKKVYDSNLTLEEYLDIDSKYSE